MNDDELPSLTDSGVGRWSGLKPEPIEFVVEDLFPRGMVTLLTADGGGGKTLLMQTASTCIAAGLPFLGLSTVQGIAVGIFAEDPDKVLHFRQHRLNAHFGLYFNALDDTLKLKSVAGLENTSLWQNERATPFLRKIEREIAAIGGGDLLTLDNVALLYHGDEMSRIEVTRFVNALNGIADRLQIAIVLITHTSKSVNTSARNAASGSTAWINACRSVLRINEATENEPTSLEVIKANHSRTGRKIPLRWEDGLLLAIEQPGGVLGAIERRNAERVFLDLLDQSISQNRPVSDSNRAPNYAPKRFSEHPDRDGFTKRDFQKAMESLFATGRLVLVEYGRLGDLRRQIARAPEPATSEAA